MPPIKKPTRSQLLAVAVRGARGAGRVLSSRFTRNPRIEFKGELNLVTEADRRAEAEAIRVIRRSFPDHGILAEEGGERSRSAGSANYRWVIDPLDGTTNFAHTFPMFCVSVAVEENGRVVVGVVFDPIRRELFSVVRGGGAKLNGRRIRVSRAGKLKESLLVTGFSYDIRRDPTNLRHFANFSLRARGIRRTGSAALDLCYTAMGRFDGFWEMKLSPWDVAAGSLIVTEAGGTVTDFGGGPFRIDARQIVASNGRIHRQMLAVIRSRESALP